MGGLTSPPRQAVGKIYLIQYNNTKLPDMEEYYFLRVRIRREFGQPFLSVLEGEITIVLMTKGIRVWDKKSRMEHMQQMMRERMDMQSED